MFRRRGFASITLVLLVFLFSSAAIAQENLTRYVAGDTYGRTGNFTYGNAGDTTDGSGGDTTYGGPQENYTYGSPQGPVRPINPDDTYGNSADFTYGGPTANLTYGKSQGNIAFAGGHCEVGCEQGATDLADCSVCCVGGGEVSCGGCCTYGTYGGPGNPQADLTYGNPTTYGNCSPVCVSWLYSTSD